MKDKAQTTEARVFYALRVSLGLGLGLLVLLNVINAAGRYAGAPSLAGMDELLVFGMIWLVMIGAILATKDGAHLSINLLPTALNAVQQRALGTVVNILVAAICLFVAWHSWSFIERIWAIGQKSMGLGVPMVVPHFAIFVGFAGMGVVALFLVFSEIRHTLQRRGG